MRGMIRAVGLGFRVAALPLSTALVAMGATACSKKAPPPDEPPPVIASAVATVPPVALSGVAPVSAFADASVADDKPPYEQARTYEAGGQHWLARLVLERKALGSDGTKREIELLASICHEQGDEACIDECSKRLGKKLKFDARSPRQALAAGEHKEPDNDAARARDHLLKRRFKDAREILEPKVLDGSASKEEIRLLRNVCQQQGDRMCTALCGAKLK
jgi:hypothetical protein